MYGAGSVSRPMCRGFTPRRSVRRECRLIWWSQPLDRGIAIPGRSPLGAGLSRLLGRRCSAKPMHFIHSSPRSRHPQAAPTRLHRRSALGSILVFRGMLPCAPCRLRGYTRSCRMARRMCRITFNSARWTGDEILTRRSYLSASPIPRLKFLKRPRIGFQDRSPKSAVGMDSGIQAHTCRKTKASGAVPRVLFLTPVESGVTTR